MSWIAAACGLLTLAGAWQASDSNLLFLLHGPVAFLWLEAAAFRSPGLERRLGRCSPHGALAAFAAFLLLQIVAVASGVVRLPWTGAVQTAFTMAMLVHALQRLLGGLRLAEAGLPLGTQLGRAGGAVALGGAALLLLAPFASFHPPHQLPPPPPTIPGAVVEDLAFRAADGTALAGWLATVSNPRGNVVLGHGHGQHRGQMSAVFQALAGAGYNVLAFDFRGHGASAPASLSFGVRETADVVAAARALQARAPDAPLFLVGISYSAIVSAQALRELPECRAAWLDSPCDRFAAIAERHFAALPPPLRRALIAGYETALRLDAGFSIRSIAPLDKLAGVRVPILVAHGERDALIPFESGRTLHERYSGPKECWWVPCGHGVAGGVPFPEYRDRLLAFLDRHRRPAPAAGPNRAPATSTRSAGRPAWGTDAERRRGVSS